LESGAAEKMVGYYGGDHSRRPGHQPRPQPGDRRPLDPSSNTFRANGDSSDGGTTSEQRVLGRAAKVAPSHNRVRTTRRTERRGRGIRGPLIPQSLPGWKSRSEKFDSVALAAFAPIDARWHKQLSKLDIAVDDVPMIRVHNPDSVNWPPEIVADGPVPLSRLVAAGLDKNGETTRARIVLFRRPLELRAKHPSELSRLLHEVLVEQVATYLGVEVEEIDPEAGDPAE
jgi:predicted Zn-dependent protease with MMP-like domain